MKVTRAPLDGVLVFEPDRFEDERGWFQELWNEERYRAAGLDVRFVQTNVSSSARGVLRGLHYQAPPHGQGKLISVLDGAIFDVVVDIRRGSETFGQWYGCELSRENRKQLWVPEGFAHGFLVTGDTGVVIYGCTAPYVAEADRALLWSDPGVGVQWPSNPLAVSAKDTAAPGLRSTPDQDLPDFTGGQASVVPPQVLR